MKNWKSIWIAGVALLHTVYAVMVFGNDYILLLKNGLLNSIDSARTGLSVWFFLFGQLLFIVALLVFMCERANRPDTMKLVGINLIFMAVLGVVIMPDSGFWLIFPPAIAMTLNLKSSLQKNTI